mmetsp:Transcript_499/g.553  ORF Transcript_499/g.553 Transcript_499/m.553 type:complete len:105 (+) Transcript_499:535-849(+)
MLKLASLVFQLNNICAISFILYGYPYWNKKRGKMGLLLHFSSLFFWLICSGAFSSLSRLLNAPLLEFVLLLFLLLTQMHYSVWEDKLKKVALIGFYGLDMTPLH